MKSAGIILAAGKGTRFAADGKNKVAVSFLDTTPVRKAAETMQDVVDDIYVVVGHESESVKDALQGLDVTYVLQEQQNGTGHACNVALEAMKQEYDTIIVGNGDHMMFYTPDSLKHVVNEHQKQSSVATCVSSHHDDVSSFGFGRILRDEDDNFIGIKEQKDASEKERNITEFNSGLAVFNMPFLQSALSKLTPENAAHELYITDVFGIAHDENKQTIAVPLSFKEVGIGINSRDDYDKAVALFESEH